jgi:hypothetical protein
LFCSHISDSSVIKHFSQADKVKPDIRHVAKCKLEIPSVIISVTFHTPLELCLMRVLLLSIRTE